MNRKLLIFLLFFLCTGLTYADEVTIGTGTTKEKVPVYAYYGYTYSQSIYLQSELGDAGTITHVKWNFAGSSLSNSNDWTIYIGHTSKSSFSGGSDWISIDDLTQVYSAVFADPGTSGWIEFDIDNFEYNGTDNLVIAIDENTSGYNGSSDKFYCTSGTSRSIYKYNDSSNPNPVSPPYGSTLNYFPNITLNMEYNSSYDGHDLNVTDLGVGGAGYFMVNETENLIASINNSGTFEESNYTVEFYQLGTDADILLGTVNQIAALQPSESIDISLETTFTALGEYQIYAKLILSGDEVPENNISDTITVVALYETPEAYTEDFEGGIMPEGWTVLNEDEDSKQWDVNSNNYSHSGNYLCSVGHNYNGNDDWLITPLAMPIGNANTFEFFAKSGSTSYMEDFEVWVSSTGTNVEDFTVKIGDVNSVPSSWTEYTYDVSAYNGQQIYLAIRCVSVNELNLNIDDVTYTPAPDMSYKDLQAGTIIPADQIIEGLETEFTISITNNGDSEIDSFSLTLYQLENSVETILNTIDITETVAATETVTVNIPNTFNTYGTFSVFGKVSMTGDLNPDNDQTTPIDISVEQVAVPDLTAISFTFPEFIAAGEATNFTINVQNIGNIDVENYTVGLYQIENNQPTELASSIQAETLTIGTSADIVITYSFATEGDYPLYAKVLLDGDADSENDSTQINTVNVAPEGSLQITVGTNESTLNIPADMYYKTSLSESIYMAEELAGAGLIKHITYYTDFASDYPDQPIKIWMGETDRTELLEGDWIPSTELDLVLDTEVDWIAGEHQVTLILDQAFTYSGENLVVMVERNTTSYKNDCLFKGNETAFENRTLLYKSDSEPANPVNPPGVTMEMGYSEIPKTTFYVEEILPSSIEGIVNDGTNPIVGAQVQLIPAGTEVITSDLGAFTFSDLFVGNSSIIVSADGYINDTISNIYLNSGEVLDFEITLEAISYVQIDGTIIGNDAPEGLEAATATLAADGMVFEIVTNASGTFSFENIQGNQTYTLTVSKDGYQSEETQVICGVDDLELESIMLIEILNPATELTVTDSVLFTHLQWVQALQVEREMVSYSVYRGLVNMAFEDYTLISEDIIDTNFIDFSWNDLENGSYKYGITTIYDGGYSSTPVYSEAIEKGALVLLEIAVEANNGFENSVDGAVIELINQDGNPQHVYNLTANDTINNELIVASGIYDIFATHEAYLDYEVNDVVIYTSQQISILLDEIIFAPQNLVAIDIDFGKVHFEWEMSASSEKGFMYYQIFLNDEFIGESVNTSYDLTGLIYNTTYTIGVSARYSSGDSEMITTEHAHMYDVAVGKKQATFISVYPNPAYNSISFNKENIEEIHIFNIHGQSVKVVCNIMNIQTIDVSDLPAGEYLLRFHSSEQVQTGRFTIVR
ncbi:MAG: choice-of-anchor J domain-containing protein [Bacteroidales bacterium]|nr:choice-of-anchor J domain-containing protein [Bacteroidales bacterium]